MIDAELIQGAEQRRLAARVLDVDEDRALGVSAESAALRFGVPALLDGLA